MARSRGRRFPSISGGNILLYGLKLDRVGKNSVTPKAGELGIDFRSLGV